MFDEDTDHDVGNDGDNNSYDDCHSQTVKTKLTKVSGMLGSSNDLH